MQGTEALVGPPPVLAAERLPAFFGFVQVTMQSLFVSLSAAAPSLCPYWANRQGRGDVELFHSHIC